MDHFEIIVTLLVVCLVIVISVGYSVLFLAQRNDCSLCDYGSPTAGQSISQESQDPRHSSDPQTMCSGRSAHLDSLDLNLQSDRPAGNLLIYLCFDV